MSHRLSKTTETALSAVEVDVPTVVEVQVRGSQTHVGTSDVSPPVKNNTDRMNQLVG